MLSRSIAEQGHYPAIDLEQSISRVMHNVTDARQLQLARALKALCARYQRNRDLISVGAYAAGTDPLLDEAITRFPAMELYLQQRMDQKVTLTQSLIDLGGVFGIGRPAA